MKNTIELIAIIALAALIGFAMIACDNGNGGNGGKGGPKTINIRAYNNKGVGPSTSRSVMGGRAVQPGFDDIIRFYEGKTFDNGITPTKLQLCLWIHAYTSTGRHINLGEQVFDLTKGITLRTPETFEVGETISAVTFWINGGGQNRMENGKIVADWCEAEFEWPFGSTNEEKKASFEKSILNGLYAGDKDPNSP
jgi:hypothetical protein